MPKQESATETTNPSFIQTKYDVFNGHRHAARTPLTVTDNGIAPLSDDVAVPAEPLGSSRRLFFPNRLELERSALPGNGSVIHHL